MLSMTPEQSRFVEQDADFGLRMERAIIGYYKGWLRPGDCALDGGGADGWHTWGMADAVGEGGKVITVEAIPEIADKIAATAKAWGKSQVKVVNSALSDGEGEAEFFVGDNFGLSSLHRHSWLDGSRTIRVPLTTIDSLVSELGRLEFMKLDIEGHEPIALRGASNVLARHRPLVIFESGYQGALASIGLDTSDLIGIWERAGYRLWDLAGMALSEEVIRDPAAPQFLSHNIIATPDDAAAAFVRDRSSYVLAHVDEFT